MKEGSIYSFYIVKCAFHIFLSYTTITLNSVTIHAIRKTWLPKPLKTLLLSLAVSDLGVGLMAQPLYISSVVMEMKQNTENNPTYNATYIVFLIVGSLFSWASFLGVTALSVDRFLAIHLHLRYQELVTHKRVVTVVISVWAFSTFSSIAFLLWIPTQKTKALTIYVVIEIVCLILTALFYCKIYLAVRRQRNQIQALQVQRIAENGEMLGNFDRLKKTAVGTFYVYLVFLVCYLPAVCVKVVVIIFGDFTATKHVNVYAWTMVFLNSSLNPLIYCWKMGHFRHAMMNILRNAFSFHN